MINKQQELMKPQTTSEMILGLKNSIKGLNDQVINYFEEITKLSKQINHLDNDIFENKQKDTNNSIQLDVSTLKTEIQALKVEMSEVGDQLKKIENKFNVPNDLISKMLFNILILGRLLRYLYT